MGEEGRGVKRKDTWGSDLREASARGSRWPPRPCPAAAGLVQGSLSAGGADPGARGLPHLHGYSHPANRNSGNTDVFLKPRAWSPGDT